MPKDQMPTYQDLGFSTYLERPLTGTGGGATAAAGSSSQLNFDSTQTSGSLGDKIQVGNITIDGSVGRIIVNDGEVDRVIIGRIG
jgi:hypothetical protein